MEVAQPAAGADTMTPPRFGVPAYLPVVIPHLRKSSREEIEEECRKTMPSADQATASVWVEAVLNDQNTPWPPRSWLRKRFTPAKAREHFRRALGEQRPRRWWRRICRKKPESDFPEVDPLQGTIWGEFLALARPQDLIYWFSSPWRTWRSLCGREGYVIVRNGRPAEYIITGMN